MLMLNNGSTTGVRESYMFEEDTQSGPESAPEPAGKSNMLRNVLIAVAAVYMVVSLYFIFETRGRLATLETAEKAAEDSAATHNAAIMKKLGMTEASMQQENEELQSKLSETQKEAASRAAQLAAQQKQSEQRLRQESQQQFTAVNSEVGGVKTELTGAKTDIASTRTDLDATKMRLEKTIGDLGVQSGLVAKDHDELEYLKHKGDRNYYEFTLTKGAKPQPVSTVSLQLKKADAKKGKFTLNVTSDDKTIEKKDRNVSEPIQFYSGRDRMLFELVIWTVDKDKATGYLSTPKGAPVPVTASAPTSGY